VVNFVHSVAANNGTNGIQANGANALVRISQSSILDNTTGIGLLAGGTVSSTNPATTWNSGNATPGAPNGAVDNLE
jgi:hypothetical protein